MANNVERSAVIEDREILRSAAGLNDIKSRVCAAFTVPEFPEDSGRYILPKGTVMTEIDSDEFGRVQPITSDNYDGEDVVGITASKIEFAIAADLDVTGDTSTASNQDEAVALLHHGCNFDVRYLTGYDSNENEVAAALPTCIFTDVS